MTAQPRMFETGVERVSVPYRVGGKTYLRFDAVPAARPASAHADIVHLPAALVRGVGRKARSTPQASGVMALVKLWRARFLERRHMARELESFTDEMLKDLGLTRSQARAMAHTPFWLPDGQGAARS